MTMGIRHLMTDFQDVTFQENELKQCEYAVYIRNLRFKETRLFRGQVPAFHPPENVYEYEQQILY